MGNQKTWSLKAKLTLMGFVIGALAPILGMYMNYKINAVSENYSVVADVKLDKTRILGDLQFKFRQIRIPLRSVPILGSSEDEIATHITDVEAAIADFTQSLEAYEETIEHTEEKSMLYELKAGWGPFLKFGGDVLGLIYKLNEDPSLMPKIAEMIRTTCHKKAEPVETALKRLVDFQTSEANNYVRLAHERESAALFAAWAGSALSIVIALLLSWAFSTSLNRQLRALSGRLLQMSRSVRNSSKQLENSAVTLTDSTSQESAALTETAASMEQVSAMIEQTSRHVESTLEVADEGKTEASNGRRELERMIHSMNDIQDSNDKLEKMVKLIMEIREKTQVINDIVFETRLLSFNASIEAARAGAKGKGFAVVAEEVGNLANVSGKAADEIRSLLESSTVEVNEIVRSTKERINKGRSNAEDCERAFDKMGTYLEKIAESVGAIEQASREQERGVRECNTAISQMDSLSQSISLEASQLTREAGHLASQSTDQTSVVNELDSLIEGGEHTSELSSSGAHSRNDHQAIPFAKKLTHSRNKIRNATDKMSAEFQENGESADLDDSVDRNDPRWKRAS